MHDYNSLSPDSKVWVYQSNRKLERDEVNRIRIEVNAFTTDWVAHQQSLKAWGDIRYNRFIILMVDETGHSASGCSIDASIYFLKELEKRYELNLLDRLSVAFRYDEDIRVVHKDEIPDLLSGGTISEDTVIFNNLVQSKAEFENNWEIPLKNSWVAQVL